MNRGFKRSPVYVKIEELTIKQEKMLFFNQDYEVKNPCFTMLFGNDF